MSEDFEIRMRITQAAMEHFVKFGYSKATMDEIAESLGMSKKTLYQYFASKQELLQAIIANAMHTCDTFCESVICNQTMDFSEKLRQMLTFFSRMNGNMSRHLVEDLRKHIPETWKQIKEWRQVRIAEQFGQVIEEGMAKGALRRDMDAKLVTMIYLGFIESMLNPDVLSELPYEAPQVFESVWKIFFEGMLTPNARAQFSVAQNSTTLQATIA